MIGTTVQDGGYVTDRYVRPRAPTMCLPTPKPTDRGRREAFSRSCSSSAPDVSGGQRRLERRVPYADILDGDHMTCQGRNQVVPIIVIAIGIARTTTSRRACSPTSLRQVVAAVH
jgi:hypothetical protein